MNQASEAEKKGKENSKFSITVFVNSFAHSISPAHLIAVLFGRFYFYVVLIQGELSHCSAYNCEIILLMTI